MSAVSSPMTPERAAAVVAQLVPHSPAWILASAGQATQALRTVNYARGTSKKLRANNRLTRAIRVLEAHIAKMERVAS